MNIRRCKTRLLFVLGFTLVHMALSMLTFLWSFSVVMAHADDGLPLTAGGRIILWLSQAFQAPLISGLSRVDYLQQMLPSFFVIIILFLNSLLWGLVALGIVVLLTRKKQNDAGAWVEG